VTEHEGVSDDEFARVAAQLYDETVTLDEKLLAHDKFPS
jgi:hypothetical protein